MTSRSRVRGLGRSVGSSSNCIVASPPRSIFITTTPRQYSQRRLLVSTHSDDSSSVPLRSNGIMASLQSRECAGQRVRHHRKNCVDYQQLTGAARHRSRSETRSDEHTSELQSLMRTSYAVFCLKKN